MLTVKQEYYQKRGMQLVEVLKKRHFDAWYCEDKETALQKALALIGKEETIGWGGAMSAHEIGLIEALNQQGYHTFDRARCTTAEEQAECMRNCMFADVFLTGANAISMTGEMVNIDGTGNRAAAITYGPKRVLVIAGMNKVAATLQDAVVRARTIAAPINKQRFPELVTPCQISGTCADCHSDGCICNQILITRNCRPNGRIQFILVGEDLGY